MDIKLNELVVAFVSGLSDADVTDAEKNAYISSILVKARISKGMSQKEFADHMGVSQEMVSKWESENYDYTIEDLTNICEKLGLDIDHIYRGE